MRRDLNADDPAPLCLEADDVRRTTAARLPFAERLDQIGSEQIAHHMGHRRCAHSRCANQVRSRARPRLAQELQDRERIGSSEQRRSADCYGCLFHENSFRRESIDDLTSQSIARLANQSSRTTVKEESISVGSKLKPNFQLCKCPCRTQDKESKCECFHNRRPACNQMRVKKCNSERDGQEIP